MTNEKLKEIIDKHWKWMNGYNGGERAILDGQNLNGMNLIGAVLDGASMVGTSIDGTIYRFGK